MRCDDEVHILLRKGGAVVACHSPEQSATRRDAAICAVDEAQRDGDAQDGGRSSTAGGLIDHLRERALCGRLEENIDIDETKKHDEDEENAPESGLAVYGGWSVCDMMEVQTHVVPPTSTAATMAWGASRVGRGISSVIWATASNLPSVLVKMLLMRGEGLTGDANPIRLSADCSSPSIQAVPSLHPVVLEKLVKTNSASVLGEVAKSTMLITTTLIRDQYTEVVSLPS